MCVCSCVCVCVCVCVLNSEQPAEFYFYVRGVRLITISLLLLDPRAKQACRSKDRGQRNDAVGSPAEPDLKGPPSTLGKERHHKSREPAVKL